LNVCWQQLIQRQWSRHYITSLRSVEAAAEAIRSHWGIENCLHWVLDVVLNEEGWATRKSTTAARACSDIGNVPKGAGFFCPARRRKEAAAVSYAD